MTEFLLRGVPGSLRLDGWWLTETIDSYGGPLPPAARAVRRRAPTVRRSVVVLLVTLILAADFLFWHQAAPGLSLAIFAILLAIAISLTCGFLPRGRERTLWLILFAASLLPAIEHVQALSVLFALAGLLAYTVRVCLVQTLAPATLAAGMTRLAMLLPWLGAADGLRASRDTVCDVTDAAVVARFLRAWALPLAVGSVFILAFTAANPVIDGWVSFLLGFQWDPGPAIRRLLFWGTVAAFAWPFLTGDAHADWLRRPFTVFPETRPALPGVNASSIANSLVLFNLIFAVQTGLDLAYLWGGADLPSGTTHAAYAHRGAYPLVATALLAGAFALISRPFTDGHPRLRALLAFWIAQNVVLVLSSIYRLDLYVDVYGLTYLRLRAAIWMALVAAGLVLLGWQLWRGKSNLWLLGRNAVLLAFTLYACAFVNFADVIARYNLAREYTAASAPPDFGYICSLGPYAASAFADYAARTGFTPCGPAASPVTRNWRDWGFRKWRVQRYLAATAASDSGRAFD